MSLHKITIVWALPLIVLLVAFFAYETWMSMPLHGKQLVRWWNNHNITYYPGYLWIIGGSIIFPLMGRFWKKNMEMTRTFTHELTHTITALLTFREVTEFHARRRGDGMIYSIGNQFSHFLVSLAPYCFPIYTVPLLMLRCLITTSMLPIIDVLIGFTIGLHIDCIKRQIGNHQTDIIQWPIYLNYTYIIAILLFFLNLILISFEPKNNIFYAFIDYAHDLWQLIVK